MKKITLLKTLTIALLLVMGVGNAWGQYSGSGTFTKITAIGDLTDGYYVITNENDQFAMNNTNAGNYFQHTSVLPSSGQLINPAAAIVWKIETNEGGKTIYNETSAKYVSYTGTSNASYAVDAVETDNQRWIFTYAESKFTAVNMEITTRQLSYNSSSPRFACYSNAGQQELQLYKMESSVDPEPTNHPTAFTATVNSTSQITVSWTDATGDQLPAAYLVKAAVSPETPTAPEDGTAEADAALVKNISYGTESAVFEGLAAETTYNFAIWPYTNSSTAIDYKLGSEPTASETTLTPLGTPVSIAATSITNESFTANWNTTSGATSYRLDVSEHETFTEAGGDATDLIISEYIEGSSNNKAIEIFNGTGSSVDLSDYSLKKQVNGAGDFGSDLTLVGLIDNNTTYVIVYNQANPTLQSYADLISNSSCLSFNGNDAVALFKSGVMIDVVGVVDQVSPDWGANVTLVRKSNISGPSTVYDAEDWDSYAIDTFEHLGSHTFSGGSTPSFVDGYEDLEVNGTSQSVEGLDPNTTYYYRVRATNGSETSENSNTIEITTNKDAETVSGEVSFSELVNVGEGTVVTVSSGNLTIDAEASLEDLVVEAGAMVDVDPGIDLFVNGDLYLKSPSGNGAAASFIDKGTTLVGGNYIIERHLDAYTTAEDGWHLLASPFAEDMAIAGSDFAPVEGDDDLYGWDEPNFTWLNYFQGNPTNFEAGKGYLVAYKSSETMRDFTADSDNNAHLSNDVVLIDNASRTNNGGWHLVGNSFLSAVTWDTDNTDWLADNIEASAQILDVDQSGNYLAVDKSETIQALQGFFVRVTAHGDNSLVLPADARTHSAGNFLKSSTQNALELKVTNDKNGYFDKTKVKILEGATQAYDADVDGSKLKGFTTAPQLYTVSSDEKELSINVISNNDNEVQMPLHFEARFDAAYTIQVEDNTLPEGVTIFMTDFVLNQEINLNTTPTYTFTASEGDNPNRFLLHFGAVGIDEHVGQSSIRAYTYNNTLYVQNSLEDAAIRVIDLQGRLLLEQKLNGTGLQSLPLDFPAGVYMVQLLNSKEQKSVKVIVE